MAYFIRYTENANLDFKRKCSVHNSDYKVGEVSMWNDEDERSEEEILAEKWECEVSDVIVIHGYYSQELQGLCAFELESTTEEEAIEEAASHHYNNVYNTTDFPTYAVFAGRYVDDCPEGCLMIPSKLLTSK